MLAWVNRWWWRTAPERTATAQSTSSSPVTPSCQFRIGEKGAPVPPVKTHINPTTTLIQSHGPERRLTKTTGGVLGSSSMAGANAADRLTRLQNRQLHQQHEQQQQQQQRLSNHHVKSCSNTANAAAPMRLEKRLSRRPADHAMVRTQQMFGLGASRFAWFPFRIYTLVHSIPRRRTLRHAQRASRRRSRNMTTLFLGHQTQSRQYSARLRHARNSQTMSVYMFTHN
jgi:G3E family GTPase